VLSVPASVNFQHELTPPGNFVMIDKSRALTLLGSGLGPTEVGTTLGCDPSYVSQLLMDDGFRTQVLALRIENLQAATQRDRKIDKLEDEVLEKLADNIRWMTKTNDIIRAFAIINAAKRRGAVTGGDLTVNQTIVAISLPPAARREFITNQQGEVVQVGDKTTLTMPLQNLLRDRLKKQIPEKVSSEREGSTYEQAATDATVNSPQGEKAAA